MVLLPDKEGALLFQGPRFQGTNQKMGYTGAKGVKERTRGGRFEFFAHLSSLFLFAVTQKIFSSMTPSSLGKAEHMLGKEFLNSSQKKLLRVKPFVVFCRKPGRGRTGWVKKSSEVGHEVV